jgi:LacI family transcriptional regulator
MAIEEAAYDAGYTILHGYSRDDVTRQRRLLETMVEHRVDGVILLPAIGTTADELQATVGVAAASHILIARRVAGHKADYSGIDNTASGRLLGEHLARQGATSVAFLGGPASSSAREERERGLRAGLRAAGIELTRELSIPTSAEQSGGVEAVERLLAAPERVDAVVGYNDVVAFGVLDGLRAHGLEPGRDVAVAGFDNVADALHRHDALTSVEGFPDLIGAQATARLLARLDDPDLPVRKLLIKPRLEVRASTAAWSPRPQTRA